MLGLFGRCSLLDGLGTFLEVAFFWGISASSLILDLGLLGGLSELWTRLNV